MSQMDLLRAMEEKGITGLHRQHLSEVLRGSAIMTPAWARKIEIGLDLPMYTLVRMVGMPKTVAGMKEIEKLGDM